MYKNDTWKGILMVAEFAVLYTYHTIKEHIMVQLLFFHENIVPIKHIADWK